MEPIAGLIPIFISVAIGGLICLFILGFIGLFILAIRGMNKQSVKKMELAQAAAASWLFTTGKVIKSRVEMNGYEHVIYEPKIIYEYTVDGSVYQGEQIAVGQDSTIESELAYAAIDRYPLGAAVTVFYNPDNPAEAALER